MTLDSLSSSNGLKRLENEKEEVIPIQFVPVPQDVACEEAPQPTLSEKTMDWTFLKSNAFYAGIIGSASIVLVDSDFSTNEWYVNLGKFLGLVAAAFWGTRTLDRVTDKFSK